MHISFQSISSLTNLCQRGDTCEALAKLLGSSMKQRTCASQQDVRVRFIDRDVLLNIAHQADVQRDLSSAVEIQTERQNSVDCSNTCSRLQRVDVASENRS